MSDLTFTTNNTIFRYRALQVQTVTIAATHQDEVQIITTAAPAIVGVQLMSTSADEGETVAGNFSLQFPERQLVRYRAYRAFPPKASCGGFCHLWCRILSLNYGGLSKTKGGLGIIEQI